MMMMMIMMMAVINSQKLKATNVDFSQTDWCAGD